MYRYIIFKIFLQLTWEKKKISSPESITWPKIWQQRIFPTSSVWMKQACPQMPLRSTPLSHDPELSRWSEAEGNWLAVHDSFGLSPPELVGQVQFSSGESEVGNPLRVFRQEQSGEPPPEQESEKERIVKTQRDILQRKQMASLGGQNPLGSQRYGFFLKRYLSLKT